MPTVEAIETRLARACAEGTASAAACVAWAGGTLLHRSHHGTTLAGGGRPVEPETPFEVASLTKVMATTALAMMLHGEGRLPLEAPVAELLPGFARRDAAKGGVTVEDLLAHRAGLPAWRPWWRAAAEDRRARPLFAPPEARPAGRSGEAARARARRRVLAAVLAEPLEAPPGARALYSDAGFIVLGAVLERVAGAPLDVLFAERLILGMGLAAAYGPVGRAGDRPEPERVPATRRAESRGGALLQGEVDDDNAFALGGVAGHAGLFATADAVGDFGEAVRRAWRGDTRTGLPTESVRRFLVRDPKTPGSTRALGWDTPSGPDSHAGRRLDRDRSFGHLGFTGCSLWIDLSRDLVVALLTNRLLTGAEGPQIRALRAEVHDGLVDALEGRA